MAKPILLVVCQQMEMGVHDSMQQLSKQLHDIVKPMLINEIQKA